MGGKFYLLVMGAAALLFAVSDYFYPSKNARTKLGDAKAKVLRRRSLFIEFGIAAFAFVLTGFLQFTHTDIPPATWHKLVTITLAVMTVIACPGIYGYLSWKQRRLTLRHRLPDGTLSERDTRLMKSMGRLKNMFLLMAAGGALLVLFTR
ncbi:MAG TPA: hypothetical protein VGM47_11565 [Gammaproteobacteria bacterium]|jgi:hypothetical protein